MPSSESDDIVLLSTSPKPSGLMDCPRPRLCPRTPLLRLVLDLLARRDLANPSISRHTRSIRIRLSNCQPTELIQDRSSCSCKTARVRQHIRRTCPSKRIVTRAVAARGSVQRCSEVLRGICDVVEYAAFDQDVGVFAFECVAGVVGPVVVHCVQEGATPDFGGAAGGVVDVVAFEGDLVVGADEEERP